MKERVSQAILDAEKEGDKVGLAVLRLLKAVITDRERSARKEGNFEGLTDNDIYRIIVDFQQQREESAQLYDERGSIEQAASERQEIEVIQNLLPKKLTESEVVLAIDRAIKEIGACCIRDKGRVMQALKSRYQLGQMDFRKAGPIVLSRLS